MHCLRIGDKMGKNIKNRRLTNKPLTGNGRVNADIMIDGQIIKIRDESIVSFKSKIVLFEKKFK